jgi:hypothetical protein
MCLALLVFAAAEAYADNVDDHEALQAPHRASQTTHRTEQAAHEGSQDGHRAQQSAHRAAQVLHRQRQTGHEVKQAAHRGDQATHRTEQTAHEGSQATHRTEQTTHATDVDQEHINIQASLDAAETATLERACRNNERLPSIYLPLANNGRLEDVRTLVVNGIQDVIHSGEGVFSANSTVARGDTYFAMGQFKKSYSEYCRALCFAVSTVSDFRECYSGF